MKTSLRSARRSHLAALIALIMAGAASWQAVAQTTLETEWTMATSSAPWSPRQGHASLVFDDKLWVLGGHEYESYHGLNDVWSTTDGITWDEVTPSAAWAPRQFHAAAVFDDRMWVISGLPGSTDVEPTDVWYSYDGASWTLATAEAPWRLEFGHAATAFDNKLALLHV